MDAARGVAGYIGLDWTDGEANQPGSPQANTQATARTRAVFARRIFSRSLGRGAGVTQMGYPAIQMAVDLDRISALLREHLSPRQEKVVRLYFGLGCSTSFSATEIAREFRVSRQMISGIIGGAQTKLASVGLTPSVLREAARLQAKPLRHRCEAIKPHISANLRE